MGKIKLISLRKIKQIKQRLLAGEKSTTIAADYGVSSGHIRKIRIGIKDPNNPNGRWGYVEVDKKKGEDND